MSKGTNIALVAYDWQEHNTDLCLQCEAFRKEEAGGRPKSLRKNRGRPRKQPQDDAMNSLDRYAQPSWSAPQPLAPSAFLPPSAGLQLDDVQCPFCCMVVDRPVQAPCGKLACCKCITKHMQANHHESLIFPCCGGVHDSLPIPAAEVVVKVIGSLLLRCSTCQVAVELRQLREHHDSGCQAVSSSLHSQQTVDQILTLPLNAPPTTTEKKLATSVIRRMLTSSTTPSSSQVPGPCSVVSLPTGGQVSKILQRECIMYKHTQKSSSHSAWFESQNQESSVQRPQREQRDEGVLSLLV